jgi:hypothetical protein
MTTIKDIKLKSRKEAIISKGEIISKQLGIDIVDIEITPSLIMFQFNNEYDARKFQNYLITNTQVDNPEMDIEIGDETGKKFYFISWLI